MKTTKPFSTISYNTAETLKNRLQKLVDRRAISFFTFVHHMPEEDEKKPHKHLFIIPNGQIQTDALTDLLQEQDKDDPLHPLGVLPWHSSKFGDWYLYSLHDPAYLASKGQARKYHYKQEDFVSSNADYLNELVHTIDLSPYAKTREIVSRLESGTPFIEMLKSGMIPAPQFSQWKSMYDYLWTCGTVRNGAQTHTPKVDENTGELLEGILARADNQQGGENHGKK